MSTDACVASRSTSASLELDLGLPRRRRDEALPHRGRVDARRRDGAGRCASAPRTGRLSGSKDWLTPVAAKGRPAPTAAGLPDRCAAGCPARLPSSQLFFDAGRLARALAQVVELGAPHVAAALDLDRGDQRAVGLERALDAFAARDLANDEARVEAAVALGDDDAFERLDALARAFDDVDADDDGVARRERRDRLG